MLHGACGTGGVGLEQPPQPRAGRPRPRACEMFSPAAVGGAFSPSLAQAPRCAALARPEEVPWRRAPTRA